MELGTIAIAFFCGQGSKTDTKNDHHAFVCPCNISVERYCLFSCSVVGVTEALTDFWLSKPISTWP